MVRARGLLGVGSAYYKRLSRSGRPYVRKSEFREWLDEQSNESLGRALATLKTLSQSKAYLYWHRGEM